MLAATVILTAVSAVGVSAYAMGTTLTVQRQGAAVQVLADTDGGAFLAIGVADWHPFVVSG
jgi:hypothetical protein